MAARVVASFPERVVAWLAPGKEARKRGLFYLIDAHAQVAVGIATGAFVIYDCLLAGCQHHNGQHRTQCRHCAQGNHYLSHDMSSLL